MIKRLLSIPLIIILVSCTKYEIETIEGNTPPDEVVVTTDMREAYVNRLYITLLGRKATAGEFDSSLTTLGPKALLADRRKLIDSLANDEAYPQHLYAIARADYLESVDTAVIRSDYEQALAAVQNSSGNAREYWQDRVKRLGRMLRIPGQLDSNLIDLIEVHRRVVDNPYYDNINMGTENFVVACFQNFLFRYPTNVELQEASDIVNGFPGSLFFQAGSSKEDFIDIFFRSDDYYEGQVINLYRKYLFREPATSEAVIGVGEYAQHNNYLELQQKILAGDEYFFN